MDVPYFRSTPLDELSQLRGRYRQEHAVLIPGGVCDLSGVVAEIDRSGWRLDDHTGAQFCFWTQPIPARLACVLGAPAALRWVEAITGLQGLTRFEGQLKRLSCHPDQRFPWHRDHRAGQAVGLSLNLSLTPYGGGAFQQRWKWDKGLLCELRPRNLGDLHLIDVAESRLVHRVAPVVGAADRVFVAGWFFR